MVFLFSEAIGKLPSKTIGNVPSLTMGNVLSTTIGKVLAIYKYWIQFLQDSPKIFLPPCPKRTSLTALNFSLEDLSLYNQYLLSAKEIFSNSEVRYSDLSENIRIQTENPVHGSSYLIQI